MPRILLLRSLLLRTLVKDVLLSGGGMNPSTAVAVPSGCSLPSGLTSLIGRAHNPPGDNDSPELGDNGGGWVLLTCNPNSGGLSSVSPIKMGCGDS